LSEKQCQTKSEGRTHQQTATQANLAQCCTTDGCTRPFLARRFPTLPAHLLFQIPPAPWKLWVKLWVTPCAACKVVLASQCAIWTLLGEVVGGCFGDRVAVPFVAMSAHFNTSRRADGRVDGRADRQTGGRRDGRGQTGAGGVVRKVRPRHLREIIVWISMSECISS
jgi:hypothetical protein